MSNISDRVDAVGDLSFLGGRMHTRKQTIMCTSRHDTCYLILKGSTLYACSFG